MYNTTIHNSYEDDRSGEWKETSSRHRGAGAALQPGVSGDWRVEVPEPRTLKFACTAGGLPVRAGGPSYASAFGQEHVM
jgi:hypothetical protein